MFSWVVFPDWERNLCLLMNLLVSFNGYHSSCLLDCICFVMSLTYLVDTILVVRLDYPQFDKVCDFSVVYFLPPSLGVLGCLPEFSATFDALYIGLTCWDCMVIVLLLFLRFGKSNRAKPCLQQIPFP